MLFFLSWFIFAWLVWFLFADKKRWRELFPVGIFAGFLGSLTDSLTQFYPYWDYHDQNGAQSWLLYIIDDVGIYLVVTYLFIQWLPKHRTFPRMLGYWFIWTSICISMEWVYVITGHMNHSNGWTFIHSYIADWFLFWLFYQLHKWFKLDLLGADLEQLGDILFTLDTEGRLTYCRSQWLKKKGFDPQRQIGRIVYEITEMCKEEKDKLKHEKTYKKVLNGENIMFEWELYLQDRTYTFECFLSPLRDKNGKIIGIMGIDYEKKAPCGNILLHPHPN